MLRGIAAYVRRHHIALLALFFALGGTAVAAGNALVPRNSVGSAQVINGALQKADLSKLAVKALKGNRGLRGLRGAAGAQGPQGPQGPQGSQGTAGTPGQDLTYTTTLKPGQTLTGPWAVGGGGTGTSIGSAEFRPNLAATVPFANVHYVAGASATNCPGHGQAAAGHLCIYEYFNSGQAFSSTFGADGQSASYVSGAGRTGFVIYMVPDHAGANAFGSWAYTAPAAAAASAAPAAPSRSGSDLP